MATYSFKEEFIPAIKKGNKTQTIRNVRKRPPKPGEELVFKAKKAVFGRATITEIISMRYSPGEEPLIMIDGKVLSAADAARFAALDGLELAMLHKFMRRYCRNKTRWNDFIAIRWKGFKSVRAKRK